MSGFRIRAVTLYFGLAFAAGLLAQTGNARAGELPGADLSRPLTARPPADAEEITITGKSRFQQDVERHKRELARLQAKFSSTAQPAFAEKYFPGQNMLDPATWESRSQIVDPQRAHLFDTMLSEAVRGRSAW